MKKWLFLLGLIFVLGQNCFAEVEWLTDYDAALQRAKAEDKDVLLDFTGSDWCGWCKKLKADVFDSPEFGSFAKANLIMVEVDFPHQTEIDPALKAANEELGRRFGVHGYPTVVILDKSGSEVHRMVGYQPGGPSAYISKLKEIPGLARGGDAAQEEPVGKVQPPPAFVPIPPSVPNHYGDLALKAISGPKNRRLVLINNETMMVGDTAKVKTHDAKVEVTVKEIRDDSVIVIVDGKEQELHLGWHP